MAIPLEPIVCDGCGCPASPEHIAERLARLEQATRFRPVHMSVLFVGLAPMTRSQDDFYGPPQSSSYFDSLMDALEIAAPVGESSREMDRREAGTAKLIEFQRRGYYQSYLSECPIPDEYGNDAVAIGVLSRALVLRIQFNYQPKHVVLLGSGMEPAIEILKKSGMEGLLLLDRGQPLSVPNSGDAASRTVFRAALGTAVLIGARTNHPVSGYDRI